MDIYQVLCLFDVPAVVIAVIKFIQATNKRNNADAAAMKKGIQALLRSNLLSEYNRWSEVGYAPIYARENFENCWNQYHSLGENGVMDDLHERFLELPTERKES